MSVTELELKQYQTELHIHTVLSPCASVEMIPPLIVEEALRKKIDIIAITDHNAIDNIPAVIDAAKGTDLTILAGLELQTREEIHSLCLFDRYSQAESFFGTIKESFPKVENNPNYFGEQFVVDATGEFIRRESRLLITSSSISLKEAWEKVEENQGILIPAHVNRMAFGLLPVLGFIPQDIPLKILEISRHLSFEQARKQYPELVNYHLIQGGDAHMLDDIKGWNKFLLAKPTIKEIASALAGLDGRSYQNLM